jgi:hypothetical protein
VQALAKVAVMIFAVGAAMVALGIVIKTVMLLLSPTGLIALAVAGVFLLLDALGVVDLGFWDFVNSIRVGGFKISTWLTAAWLIIFQAWERIKNAIATGWDWLLLQIANIGGGIHRTWMRVCKALAPVFWTAVRGMAQAINWLIRKWNALADSVGLGISELNTEALRSMVDDSTAYYQDKIGKSLAAQQRRRDEFNKRRVARDKATADQVAAYQQAVHDVFQRDMDEQRRDQVAKDVAAKRAGLAPDTVKAGAGLPQVGTGADTGDIVGSFSAAVLRGSSPSITEAKKHTKLLEQIRSAAQLTADRLQGKMVGHYTG